MEKHPGISFFGGLVLFLGATSIGILDALRRLDFLQKSHPNVYAGITSPPSMLAVGLAGVAAMLWGGWQLYQKRISSAVDAAPPHATLPVSTVTHGASSPGASVGGDVKDSNFHVGDVHHHYPQEPRSTAGAHPDKRTDPIAADEETLESLQAVFPSSVIAELRVQQFRTTFEWRFDAVFQSFYQWGLIPEYRFLHNETEAVHTRLRDLAYRLRYLIHRDSEPLSPENAVARGFIPLGQITDIPAHNATCEAVWQTKDKVCDAYEELIRTAKQLFTGISATTPISGPAVTIEYSHDDNTKADWIKSHGNTDPRAPLKLRNSDPHETAYNVRALPLEIGGEVACFEPAVISSIPPLGCEEVIPTYSAGPYSIRSLWNFLRNHSHPASTEEVMNDRAFFLDIHYEDGKIPPTLWQSRCCILHRWYHNRVRTGGVQRCLRGSTKAAEG
jgi:hypothetical protein